jgi:uncharacterized protein
VSSAALPVNLIPELKRAARSDVRSVEVLGRGSGLHWESLDLDLSVPGLVSSVFAGPEWMAELGRVGGRRNHGVSFEEAATVFDDPLFVLQDASRNEEQRDAVIGFSSASRLLTVVHIKFEGEFIRIISAWPASPAEEAFYDQ